MQCRRLIEHQFLDAAELTRAAAFDHVSTHRPWTTREADQWNPAGEFLANERDRIEHIAKLSRRIGYRQLRHVGGGSHRTFDLRAFAGFELQSQTERVRNGQDVREQDRSIQWIARERLEGNFAGKLGRHAELQKAAGLRTRRAIFGKIASRLSHHPYGSAFHGLSQQGTKQKIVLKHG